jgi:hypothetical protein
VKGKCVDGNSWTIFGFLLSDRVMSVGRVEGEVAVFFLAILTYENLGPKLVGRVEE